MSQPGNGTVPAANLTTVQGSIQLENNTAAAWAAARQAAAAAGISLTITAPGGGYRSLWMQQDMINNPSAYDVTEPSALAAPGCSTHGYGTCVDIYTASANNWMISYGGAYGFVRDRYPQYSYEFNHWHYTGANSIGPSASQLGENVFYLRNADTGQIGIFGVAGRGYHIFASATEYSTWLSVISTVAPYQGTQIATPPSGTAASFVNVSTSAWNTVIAVMSGS